MTEIRLNIIKENSAIALACAYAGSSDGDLNEGLKFNINV